MKLKELRPDETVKELLEEASEETVILTMNGEVRYRIEPIDADDLLDESLVHSPSFQKRVQVAVEEAHRGEGKTLDQIKTELREGS